MCKGPAPAGAVGRNFLWRPNRQGYRDATRGNLQESEEPLTPVSRLRSSLLVGCHGRGGLRRRVIGWIPMAAPGRPPASAAGDAPLRLLCSGPPRLRGLPTLPGRINWSQHITFLSTFLPSHCPASCSASVMTRPTEVRLFHLLTSRICQSVCHAAAGSGAPPRPPH